MIQLSVEHLSGSRRGEKDVLERFPATLGCGPGVDVRVPEAAPAHARIVLDGKLPLLLSDAGHVTRLRGAAVVEASLHDGDVIELGAGGPRLRFRRDVVAPRRAEGLARPDARLVLALAVVVAAGFLAWSWHLSQRITTLQVALEAAEVRGLGFERRVEEQRRRAATDRRSMEERIRESRLREEKLRRRLAGAAGVGEVEALRSELQRVQWRLVALEGERAAAERIIREYGSGVCLIQGAYAFYDSEGRPLRYRVDESGEKAREADGSVAVQVGGEGPVHSLDTIGTGFLVEASGLVITNRHVIEPWWKDRTAESLAEYGYTPRLVHLRAFFPRVAEPLPAHVERVAEIDDLAVLRVDVGDRRIPVLPMDASPRGAVAGQPVVVLGYPTGLEAILAKTDGGLVSEILEQAGTGDREVTEALARRGLIRPSMTQGHIGDVTRSDVVLDAPTTHGGSGGPVFNKHGQVIAVGYAVLPQFLASSYGVPVRRALDLLEGLPPPSS